jgi:hypothetical protein
MRWMRKDLLTHLLWRTPQNTPQPSTALSAMRWTLTRDSGTNAPTSRYLLPCQLLCPIAFETVQLFRSIFCVLSFPYYAFNFSYIFLFVLINLLRFHSCVCLSGRPPLLDIFLLLLLHLLLLLLLLLLHLPHHHHHYHPHPHPHLVLY